MSDRNGRPDWAIEGRDWPHRSASRFVFAGGHRFHVQLAGSENAEPILLIHGTGAASHSFRHLIGPLSSRHLVIAPDLPGHGFTASEGTPDLSLPGMVRAMATLLGALSVRPKLVIGHSAGAAIAIALAATGGPGQGRLGGVGHVVGINGAFLPIRGNRLLSPMAKALFANPFSAAMFSALATATPLGGNLLQSTRSEIDEAGRAIYRMLIGCPAHVRGALGMMAAWDLSHFDGLVRGLDIPLTLIAAADDPMVPPGNSAHVARIASRGRFVSVDSGGHLLHESRPSLVIGLIEDSLAALEPNGVDAA